MLHDVPTAVPKGPAVIAFIQAGLGLFMFAGLIESPPMFNGEPSLDLQNNWALLGTLAEVVVLVGFATAFLKRHLWGAYGLITLAAMEFIGKGVMFGPLPALLSLVFVFVYWLGANSLRRIEHIAPLPRDLNRRQIIWLAVICMSGHVLLGFVFGLFGFRHVMAALPVYWILSLGWDAVVLSFLLLKERKYTFESVIGFWLSISVLDLLVGTPLSVMFLGHEGKNGRGGRWRFVTSFHCSATLRINNMGD